MHNGRPRFARPSPPQCTAILSTTRPADIRRCRGTLRSTKFAPYTTIELTPVPRNTTVFASLGSLCVCFFGLYVAYGTCGHAWHGHFAALRTRAATLSNVLPIEIETYEKLYIGWPRVNVDHSLLRFAAGAAGVFNWMKSLQLSWCFIL